MRAGSLVDAAAKGPLFGLADEVDGGGAFVVDDDVAAGAPIANVALSK